MFRTWKSIVGPFVVLAATVVARPPAQPVAQQQLTFNLPNHASYVGMVERTGQPVAGSHSWSGPLATGDGRFTLVEYENQRFVRIHMASKVLEVAGTGAALREINSDTVPECGVRPPSAPVISSAVLGDPCAGVANAVAPDAGRSNALCKTGGANLVNLAGLGPQIDALVVYTPTARGSVGGDVSMRGLILLAVDETNQAFARSNVNATLRIAMQPPPAGINAQPRPCIGAIGYTDSGVVFTDLAELILGSGTGAQVRALRDRCNADVAVMIVGNGDFGGQACIMEHLSAAFAPYAYAVVLASSASGNYAFAHEIGHLMGAGHDDRHDGNWLGMCSYSKGWHFRDHIGLGHKSIMAYRPGFKSLNYSDPSVRYDIGGDVTGAWGANGASNARTLRISADTVSRFR